MKFETKTSDFRREDAEAIRAFRCRERALAHWIRKWGYYNDQNGISAVTVCRKTGAARSELPDLLGYDAVSAASIAAEQHRPFIPADYPGPAIGLPVMLIGRLAVQHAVSGVLAQATNVEEAAPKILQSIGDVLQWQVGTVWLIRSDDNLLRPVALWHTPLVAFEKFLSATRSTALKCGQGFPGQAWLRASPVWSTDILQEREFPRHAAAAEECATPCERSLPNATGTSSIRHATSQRRWPSRPRNCSSLSQWLTDEQGRDLPPATRAAVEEELADVLLYLVRLADRLDVDLAAAARAKMLRTAEKYPVERSRGSSRKYDAP